MKETNTIARIENALIFDSRYSLTAKEQKVILLLVSKIDPIKQTRLYKQRLSFKEVQSILMDKKNGSFKKEFVAFSKRLFSKQLSFKSGMVVDGEMIDGQLNWFQSIRPIRNDVGGWDIEFMFAELLEPFLLNLKEYTQIDLMEVMPFVSGFSVRLFQIFKAYRNKMSKHQRKSKISYEVEELKDLLGVAGMYADFRNFRRKVLVPATKEINKHTSIGVKFIPVKDGRKIVGIKFEFWDKGTQLKNAKNSALSFSQEKAKLKLVDYGIEEGIALEMLYKAVGSEIVGFEDWYFFEVIGIFETKTKAVKQETKAGTLVNWFLKKKVFEQGDMFAKIMEQLAERKKRLQESDMVAWDNRIVAKDMSAAEFRTFITNKK